MLFDSLWNCKLPQSLEKQLVRIYQPTIKDGGLLVTVVPVQQQQGCKDCELFSVAFAYYAAAGDNLTNIAFDQVMMRSHLLKCFEELLISFTQLPSVPAKCLKKCHRFIGIYCTCGMPESFDSHMLECDLCESWYHFKCVGLQLPAPNQWTCDNCK